MRRIGILMLGLVTGLMMVVPAAGVGPEVVVFPSSSVDYSYFATETWTPAETPVVDVTSVEVSILAWDADFLPHEVRLNGEYLGNLNPSGDQEQVRTELVLTSDQIDAVFGLATYPLALTVAIDTGSTSFFFSIDELEVAIEYSVDTTPPELAVTVTPDTLWPPNHQYVEVTATIVVTDNVDPSPEVRLISVQSNEPDEGLGDGDTPVDILITDETHMMLRAERSGLGEGRVYTLTYEATDDSGNTALTTATVVVPKSKKK